ncbi:SEC-C metal-binding domain-containing protein [Magnetospirillum sp. 15-1]|uniref:YecA family protein n=1 Tax=Magnetospirillum sp. 15-1 TaxID=1979370 RepID=UPI001483770F|nr:SEC-C metal-binding domain-containing protein [Magnetospirillum sp. 15-1]
MAKASLSKKLACEHNPQPPSANMPCPCGSGRKYKACCQSDDRSWRDFAERMSSGKIPFRAEIRSESGVASSMEVHRASIVRDGIETVLLDDKIILSTNTVRGETTPSSAALISIPTDGLSHGTISLIGNASATNLSDPREIYLSASKREMKQKSESGLFVVASIKPHRVSGVRCFDFLFGVKGQPEVFDANGNKLRPHIAVYPDGNSNFIRLAGHDCEIESSLHYNNCDKEILPNVLRIRSQAFSEILEVVFSIDGGCVILDEMRFIKGV